MNLNFFDSVCQGDSPYTALLFGLCDDGLDKPAYVTKSNSTTWIAEVSNPNATPITFVAVDKCVITHQTTPRAQNTAKCDAMLTTANTLIFVELKDRKPRSSDWRQHGMSQLAATIALFKLAHPEKISTFKHKSAYVSNKQQGQRPFQDQWYEAAQSFYKKHRFHLRIQTRIEVT